MSVQKVRIITWHNIESAYACLNYLAEVLSEETEVELWSKTQADKLVNSGSVTQVSFLTKWYGRVKRIRYILCQIAIFFQALRSNNYVYIINDWDFYIPLFFAKKMNSRIRVVHYNTEIAGKDVRSLKLIDRFYAKHANYPEIIIECLDERAKWRKKEYNIDKPIYVINNTIPQKNIKRISGYEKTEIIRDLGFDNHYPVLIYAGRASLTRQLSDIIDCIDSFNSCLNFVFFCYGSKQEKQSLNEYCRTHCNYKNYMIRDSVSRNELIRIMQACDIGINYYVPEFSINHKYAAPTKFFEYMACGLNILSTNNEGINKIIIENRLGTCIQENETLYDSLNRMIESGLSEKNSIIKTFEDKYCYEVDSLKALHEIRKIIRS